MTVGSSKKIGVCIIVVKNKNFNTGWLYAPHDYEDGYSVDLSEQTFEPVCVPHANKILKSYKGDDFQAQIESYRLCHGTEDICT